MSDAQSDEILYLQIELLDLDIEVRINDIPLCRGRRGYQRVVGLPIREYVVQGANSLSVLVGASGQPIPPGAELLVRVARFRHLERLLPDVGVALAAIRLEALAGLPLPAEREMRFAVTAEDVVPAAWSWSRAPAVLESLGRAGVDAYVAELARLFAAADVERLLEEMRIWIEERAQAYPDGEREQAFAARRADLQRLVEIDPRSRQPDLRGLRYRMAAGGRLIEPLDAEDRPILRSREADPPFQLPVLIGMSGGRPAILR